MKPVLVRIPLAYDFARKRQALIASCAHLSVLANRVVARKLHALDYRLRAIVSGSASRPREQISQRKRQRQHPLADRLPRQDVVHEQGRRLGHPPGAAARAKPAALAAEREVVAHSLESFGSGPNRPLKAKRGDPPAGPCPSMGSVQFRAFPRIMCSDRRAGPRALPPAEPANRDRAGVAAPRY